MNGDKNSLWLLTCVDHKYCAYEQGLSTHLLYQHKAYFILFNYHFHCLISQRERMQLKNNHSFILNIVTNICVFVSCFFFEMLLLWLKNASIFSCTEFNGVKRTDA